MMKNNTASSASEEYRHNLTVADFAELFGTCTDDFSPGCRKLIEKFDFSYRVANGSELDQILLEVLKRIDSGKLTVSGRHRKDAWEKGWAENLKRFTDSNYDVLSLVPTYVRADQTIRFNGNYIKPRDSKFELNFYTVFRHYLFEKYLADFESIYEFGCGTGYNLIIMAQLFPEKKLCGLDWASASNELVNKIAHIYKYNMTGRNFDYLAPDETLEVPPTSAFITLNSLEQLGDNYEPFLQFMLNKAPGLCINSEPLLDLYDEHDLIDYVAIKYHTKRGYLGKYLTRLTELEAEGEIDILKVQRISFGSLFHEGYSYVIWKPKKQGH